MTLNHRGVRPVSTGDGASPGNLRVDGIGQHDADVWLDLSEAMPGTNCLVVMVFDDPRDRIRRGVAQAGAALALAVVVGEPQPFNCDLEQATLAGDADWATGCGSPLLTTDPQAGRLERRAEQEQRHWLVVPGCDVPRLVFHAHDGELAPIGRLPSARPGEDGAIVDLGTLGSGIHQVVVIFLYEEAPSDLPGGEILDWWAPAIVSEPVWVQAS